MKQSKVEVPSLRVLVVSDVTIHRDALVAALNRCPGICAMGRASVHAAGQAAGDTTDNSVVVVDVTAPSGLEAIAILRGRGLEMPIIALGVRPDSRQVILCAEAGAAGYLFADASQQQLLDTIDDVLAGRLVCPPKVAFDLFRRIGTAGGAGPAGSELTPREQEVLRLMGSGQSNKEIARRLGIAVSTVKNHVHHILEKSHLCSRRQAAERSPFLFASPERLEAREGPSLPRLEI